MFLNLGVVMQWANIVSQFWWSSTSKRLRMVEGSAVRSLGCVVRINILRLQKPLGTVPKQKDRPWSDDVLSNIKN
uniref:Uncharacterized protein n=1 Tax=Romanomermis culicivorax TaxID=13658 RepID=A0A915J9I5_ROMCU